jgi:hypothetical protein
MTDTYELPPDDLPPVHIDRERFDKALKGPRYMVPSGLTPEQIGEFFDTMSRIANDATAAERERCANLCDKIDTPTFMHGGHEYDDTVLLREQIAAAIRAG